MRVLDLFSGIGGFSLGLERAGMQIVAFCECDPYAQRVLAKHWPSVPIYSDIRCLSATQLAADGIEADVLAGGFPCQDISLAGRGVGIQGSRSGLWSEYARLIGELRPQYAIVENVTALLHRGMDSVLGDLAEIGYDAVWDCLPASAVGAPHRRDRIWIIAYPASGRVRCGRERSDAKFAHICPTVANADEQRLEGRDSGSVQECAGQRIAGANGSSMANTARAGCQDVQGSSEAKRFVGNGTACGHNLRSRADNYWSIEPDVGRVAHGIPSRVDRLRCLGNAVVPQVVELIGRAIMQAERMKRATQMDLTKSQISLLKWLGREEYSQYRECHGRDLDALVAAGLAQVHGQESGWNNSFIAKSARADNQMYRAVSLTERGVEVLIDHGGPYDDDGNA